MDIAWQNITQVLTGYLPSLLGALAILVVGWLVAVIVSSAIRGALRRTTLDNKIATWIMGEDQAKSVEVEAFTGKAVFWFIMLFVLVAFFQALGLTLVTQPLNTALGEIANFLPRLLGAAVLLLIAWILASLARVVITRVLGAVRLDQRLSGGAGMETQQPGISKTLADTVYWLVLLLFLPAVLGILALEGLLTPMEAMMAKVLAYLPNLFAAGVVLVVGWLLARILQRVVSNLLAAAGVDRLSEQTGLSNALGRQRLSGMLGLLVYVLVLVPVVVAALNALQLDAISRPASNVLNQILSVLPLVLGAILVVLISYVVGRLVASLVTNLLTGAGFNALLARLGIGTEPTSSGAAAAKRTPAEIAGFLVLVAVMLFASMEAFRMMGFTILAEMIADFNVFASKVLFGLLIFALGMYLGKLVQDRVAGSQTANAGFLALAARVSILVLAGAMAIQQMGIAEEIVQLVLGVALGAVAVAMAIAFGLGSRETAGRLVEDWTRNLRGGGSGSR